MTQNSRSTASELAVDMIRSAILSGELPPSSPLRQETLAKRLSLSRMPVREALRMLEAEGLVNFRPQHGFTVASFGTAEVMEAALIRFQLESLALQSAIQKHNEQTIASAKAALQRWVDAEGNHLRLHAEFHLALYEPCGMPRLIDLIQHNLNISNRFLIYEDHLLEGVRAEDHFEHTQLFNAVAEGSGRLADALLHMHIVEAAEDLVEEMKNR